MLYKNGQYDIKDLKQNDYQCWAEYMGMSIEMEFNKKDNCLFPPLVLDTVRLFVKQYGVFCSSLIIDGDIVEIALPLTMDSHQYDMIHRVFQTEEVIDSLIIQVKLFQPKGYDDVNRLDKLDLLQLMRVFMLMYQLKQNVLDIERIKHHILKVERFVFDTLCRFECSGEQYFGDFIPKL